MKQPMSVVLLTLLMEVGRVDENTLGVLPFHLQMSHTCIVRFQDHVLNQSPGEVYQRLQLLLYPLSQGPPSVIPERRCSAWHITDFTSFRTLLSYGDNIK
jgi:hypothetical protein